VEQLKTLRGKFEEVTNVKIEDNETALIPHDGELFDAELRINVGSANRLVSNTVDRTIEYNVAEKWIALDGIRAPLELNEGMLNLRLIVDRTSIEVFAQDGEVQIAKVFRPKGGVVHTGIAVESIGGSAVIVDAKTWKMQQSVLLPQTGRGG
jgi:sucrose-6-phosphate hydrolase SacC (GH32 family)